jgi:hypothetical protein
MASTDASLSRRQHPADDHDVTVAFRPLRHYVVRRRADTPVGRSLPPVRCLELPASQVKPAIP